MVFFILTLRAKHIECVEVLNRVGGLLLLPNTELATTKQVAEFYGVGIEAIKAIYHRNREELENNGAKTSGYKELQTEIANSCNLQPLEINLKKQGVSPKGSTIFTKRAILLVGFMLRDSKVAQEIRNQVLNIVESATDETRHLS